MNLETDAPQGGTEAEAVAADASQVDTGAQAPNPDDTAGQQADADEGGTTDEAGEAPKKKPWWEKRFDELTAKRYDAEREAAYWRGLAEGGRGQQPAHQPVHEGPPREDQFATYEEYDEARIAYRVKQELAAERQIQQRETVARTYEERAGKYRESKPDYDSVVNNPSLRITPVMAEVIQASDYGPQVAYHLGSNPSEAARIASLPPALQAAELGSIAKALTTPAPAAPKPIAPPPPQTVGGLAAGVAKTPEQMTMAEYIEWRKGS